MTHHMREIGRRINRGIKTIPNLKCSNVTNANKLSIFNVNMHGFLIPNKTGTPKGETMATTKTQNDSR